MPSPNQNSSDMNAWLAKANANPFSSSWEFGNPAGDTEQDNYEDESSVDIGDGAGAKDSPGTS